MNAKTVVSKVYYSVTECIERTHNVVAQVGERYWAFCGTRYRAFTASTWYPITVIIAKIPSILAKLISDWCEIMEELLLEHKHCLRTMKKTLTIERVDSCW